MRKYWAIARAGFLNSLTYRLDIFLWSFAEFFDTLIFLFVWMILFGEKQAIGGFNLPETVTYLIGTGIIGNFIRTNVGYKIESDVQRGSLSNILLKPIRYFTVRVFSNIGGKPLSLFPRIIVYGLLLWFFKERLIINRDFLTWFFLIISIFFAYIINYLIHFIFACLAFWTVISRGASGILRTIESIFSGRVAPLSFFPLLFQTVASFLPFAYTRYFPMLIYLNKLSTMEIVRGLGVQLIWIGILLVSVKKVWKRGLRRYEGVGI